ncbi:protein FAR1-RELATED SEQUENCE 4-like [Amborella trichopoda]|uniref:protein FAR1-RELATED SEQUENCE 4-like n=1 Tax=Amborella trichopoda TaxID=13333 RepID=UPI0005D35481|nr:protein FAR1-RELATED SEQUENCE 4-like [Amborella trichopoda]|eukprot:XP_011623354.1 protein FAR1-RELATED SEQUENCE 4-like [Amborella trichopoda]
MDAPTSASPFSPLNITNSKNGNECGAQGIVDEACHDFPSDEDIVVIHGEGDPLVIDAEVALARSASIEPTIRLAFTDKNEAYDYCNKYEKLVGFGITKGRTIWKHGGRISRILECCRLGFRSEMYDASENTRPYTKCECQVNIHIKKNEKNRWVIAKIVKEHNHILTMPKKTRFINSHQKIPNTVKKVIYTLESSMDKSRSMIDYFIEEAGWAENVIFIEKVLENHITRKRKQLKGKEDNVVMNWLHTKNELDPNFFF